MEWLVLVTVACFLPVAGFVALVHQTQPPRKLRERGLRLGSFIRCPHCNTLIPGETMNCPSCSTTLNEVVMPIRAYRPDYEGHPSVAVCIRCGRLNGPHWAECKHCHAPLERPTYRTDERKK